MKESFRRKLVRSCIMWAERVELKGEQLMKRVTRKTMTERKSSPRQRIS